MLASLLGASGGMSASSSASATGGTAGGGSIGGDDRAFNFKSASGAGTAGTGVPSWALVAAGLFLAVWLLRRKN